MIPSGSHRATNEAVFRLVLSLAHEGGRILDFGAGRGHLCERLGQHFQSQGVAPRDRLTACEVAPEGFRYPHLECVRIAPDSVLPFPDASFAVVYAIEVIEHLPRPYDFFAEAWRVLQPGGSLIVTAPNVQTLKSRARFFLTGFPDLHLPLSIESKNAGRLCGHIMPLGYPHFDYAFRKNGFEDIRMHVDKYSTSSRVWACLLSPLLAWARWSFRREIRRYDPAVFAENAGVFAHLNSLPVLAARSCLMSARKPPARLPGTPA